MFLIAVLILVFSIGAVLALWSMREYVPMENGTRTKSIRSVRSIKTTKGGREKIRLRGEIKLEEPGEIILPKGHKIL